MVIEAPLSKYKRNSFKIYIAICLIMGAWFAYDGYLNQGFIDKHTNEEGEADTDLLINRVAPPFFAGGAVLLGLWLYAVRGRKVVAEENELVVAATKKIPYDAIESIDKTHFEDKGVFTITYKRDTGAEAKYKLSDRQYDNLKAILDLLIAKIT